MGRGKDGGTEARETILRAENEMERDVVEGLRHGDGAGFQPLIGFGPGTWGDAPGWYGGAPLALDLMSPVKNGQTPGATASGHPR